MSRLGRLHVLTDETLQSRFTHVELARLAVEGGADTVQLREKREWADGDLRAVATEALSIVRESGAQLILDDRVELAAAIGADGVHLGRRDMAPAQARERLGERLLIGGTANTLDEAVRVSRGPVDYLGVGPVFGTRSKDEPAPTLELHTLRAIVQAVDRPVVAIGNITADRVAAVLETGAWGVAVLSAVVCCADPAGAAAKFSEAIASCRDGGSDERG